MNNMIIIRDGVLWLRKGEGYIFWDLGAFRPDPRDFLKKDTYYRGTIHFDYENLSKGEKITFPRRLIVRLGKKSKENFINVR